MSEREIREEQHMDPMKRVREHVIALTAKPKISDNLIWETRVCSIYKPGVSRVRLENAVTLASN